MHEWAHGNVGVLRFPNASVFGLEHLGRQGAIERPAHSNFDGKYAGVGQQMKRHETAVEMTSDRTSGGVANATIRHVFHRRPFTGHDLLYEGIVEASVVFSSNHQQ
mmetsp:Transcript_60710/g.71032  ORF Transcript_60710/g.71032 Transcript_60710/m.71032 type:complete len:106 (+) Transcript_60710:123-440(+)